MRDAVIIDAVRTPVGKGRPGGALSSVHPVDLLAHSIHALVDRNGLEPALVEDVIGGCVSQAGEQHMNITRNAVLAAGLPETVPAVTVDRQCGSSQQAVHFAAQGVQAGAYDIVIACGVESMSRVPMGAATMGMDPAGPAVRARYSPGLIPQGISAELIARKWALDRPALDDLALQSHRRAAAAIAAGRFDREVVPITVTGPDGAAVVVDRDEGVRVNTSPEKLASLPAAFRDDGYDRRFGPLGWVVTAGNSSQISDGSAAVLIMSGQRADDLGLRPRARFHTGTVVGDDPLMMLTGVIPATEKVLQRAGLSIDEIDAFEVNEAFASVVAAWHAETGADLQTVNVNGGAMAIGHPLGASGARLLTALVNVLEQTEGRYGLQTMCEGGGLANATIIERL
jgi:acetyl-CoA acyltransferase